MMINEVDMKKIIPYLPKKMQYALGFMVGKIGSLL